jgi:hypothetical protein
MIWAPNQFAQLFACPFAGVCRLSWLFGAYHSKIDESFRTRFSVLLLSYEASIEALQYIWT